MENEPEIRIYVACLAAYNNGILHGAWIDADQNVDDIRTAVAEMLQRSPIANAEEYAIDNNEGFEGVRIEEYTGIERVAEIAAFIAIHDRLGAAMLEYYGGNLEEARSVIENRYFGQAASLAEYVQSITEKCTEVHEHIRYYIDWQAMARDAEMSGEIIAFELAHDEMHIFSAC